MAFRTRSDFDRSFNRTRNMVRFIFGLVFVMFIAIIGFWVFVGVNVVAIADDPEAIGNYVGSIVQGYEDATNE